MTGTLNKFVLDGTELTIEDNTARTTANDAKTKATGALSKASANETAISGINNTRVVKTAIYSSENSTLTVTTGKIGG